MAEREAPDQSAANGESLESEARLRAILDTTVDAIITINESGAIQEFNRAAERMFGYRPEEVTGQNVSMLMPPEYASQHDGYMQDYIHTGKAKIIGIGREAEAQRKDGSRFPIDLAVSEVILGGSRFFTGIIRDITDQRRAEEGLVAVSEGERRQIGQDLHDVLGQQLTGISLLSQALAFDLQESDSKFSKEAADISGLAGAAVVETKRLAHGLYPTGIETVGLHAALREIAETQQRLFNVSCSFAGGADVPELDDGGTMQLYRIAQEAVNNAVKHADCEQITVRLDRDGQDLVLLVEDDGVGMPQAIPEGGAMGVHIMKYRARIIGGRLDIVRRSGGGTVVRCTVPGSAMTGDGGA